MSSSPEANALGAPFAGGRVESVADILFACLACVKQSGLPPRDFAVAAIEDVAVDLVARGFDARVNPWLLRHALSPKAAGAVLLALGRFGLARPVLADPTRARKIILFRAAAIPNDRHTSTS
ncbi:hypothetical protein SAMN07250955_11945 [Arboricoccus pini]|uniref:Uncharacterized protein n=1 Tax=Arboricoccus pini TaxID=1963835 RepID=A0A212S1C7_9PROT|nr:hypothetical protein [Arboricoccus pini]SNB78794.1 hypothetical protein SAMN07250955_11945 [Arboricoccus pini]